MYVHNFVIIEYKSSSKSFIFCCEINFEERENRQDVVNNKGPTSENVIKKFEDRC